MTNISNNNIPLFSLQDQTPNNLSINENYDNNGLYLENFKIFFRKYIANQRKQQNNKDSFSDSNSDLENLPDIYNEINNIYLKSLKNLNQFLKENHNKKGIRLEGNKLLENISIEQFNELFSQYGKGIKNKLKTQVLNYFYPNNNKPKLMGQNMHLTPIPIKKQIYLNNKTEKTDYKNAERAAVIMRRLEYTHGLGNKKYNEEKIFFYLIKGAALIIEDWWIRVMIRRGKYNIGNSKNRYINRNKNKNKECCIEENSQNKYIFQLRPKYRQKNDNYILNDSNNNNIDNNNYDDLNKIIYNKNNTISPNNKNSLNKSKKNKNNFNIINSIEAIEKSKSQNKFKSNYNFNKKMNYNNIIPNYLINNDEECLKNNKISNKGQTKIIQVNNLSKNKKIKMKGPVKLKVCNNLLQDKLKNKNNNIKINKENEQINLINNSNNKNKNKSTSQKKFNNINTNILFKSNNKNNINKISELKKKISSQKYGPNDDSENINEKNEGSSLIKSIPHTEQKFDNNINNEQKNNDNIGNNNIKILKNKQHIITINNKKELNKNIINNKDANENIKINCQKDNKQSNSDNNKDNEKKNHNIENNNININEKNNIISINNAIQVSYNSLLT